MLVLCNATHPRSQQSHSSLSKDRVIAISRWCCWLEGFGGKTIKTWKRWSQSLPVRQRRCFFILQICFINFAGCSIKALSKPAIVCINFAYFSDYKRGFWRAGNISHPFPSGVVHTSHGQAGLLPGWL